MIVIYYTVRIVYHPLLVLSVNRKIYLREAFIVLEYKRPSLLLF